MKKRVLSLLLLFAMLITMVPTMAVSSAATEGSEEEPERNEGTTSTDVSDYYSLYKTENLIAFFDALDPENGTLDLENGKWYARVFNADIGKWEKSDTLYATITGGVYNAETNATGWKVYDSGFGFSDPEFKAKDNAVVFDHTNLLWNDGDRYNNWSVEALVKVDLRDIPLAYKTIGANEFIVKSIDKVLTPAGSETDGEEGSEEVEEVKVKLNEYAVTLPEWGVDKRVTLTFSSKGFVTDQTIWYGSESGDKKTDQKLENISFNGTTTESVSYKKGTTTLYIKTPESIELTSVSVPVPTDTNTAYLADAFQFGPLTGTHWANLQAEAKDGNGRGEARWSITPNATAEKAESILVVKDKNTDFSDAFAVYTGAIKPIVVNKVAKDAVGNEAEYNLTHCGDTYTAEAIATKAEYGDHGLHIMKNEQGAVYGLRVYASANGQALTAEESAQNSTVDALIRLGVDLAVFNTMNDELKHSFLTVVGPRLSADSTKEDYEAKIAEVVATAAEKEKAKNLNEYEKLYAGAQIVDGERVKTANGGYLLSLFGAFNGDASADLAFGEWVNKLGGKSATFGNLEQWERRDGGVGFTIFYGQIDENGNFVKDAPTNNVAQQNLANNSAKFLNTRLQFGLDLLPEEDFTIEYVAKYNPIYVADENGNIALDADGNPEESYNHLLADSSGTQRGIDAYYAGAIDYIGFISSWTAKRDGIYSSQTPKRGDVIWMLSNQKPSWGTGTNWVGGPAFSGGKGLLASGIREYGKVHTYVYTRDEVLTETADTRTVEATYSVLRDALFYRSETLSTANTKAGFEYFDEPDTGDFYLSSSLPTDFYGVRIYDSVLTTKELAWNAFVDMMAYAKYDLSKLYGEGAGLTNLDRQLIAEGMMSYGFESDVAKFTANVNELKTFYAEQPKAEDTLYVTDGLTVLTAGYSGLETGYLPIDGGLTWFNAAEKGTTITLKGAEWERRANSENAGYYILKDYANTNANRNFGIFLGEEFLPEKDYTIEMILNPVGIVEFNEDGSYDRYIDTGTRYGINYDNGFAIGPLRCLIFPSASDGTPGRSTLEKRWVYDRLDYCWNQRPDDDGDGTIDRQTKFTEKAWLTTQKDDIVNFSLDYYVEPVDGSGNYTLYNDGTVIGKTNIPSEQIITNPEANNMFQLMVGMPHGVFSIRVYDRVLTEVEKLQNHAADIIYYYDLDTTLLNQIKGYFKDDPSVIFRGLADLSFDMTKEEAQKTFETRLTALWLDFEGLAVRNDYTNGLRYYFGMDQDTTTAMVNAGFEIEIGAIVNVGRNTMPTLDGRNYDYKVVAFDSIAGKAAGFFIDSNSFAVTVKSPSGNKQAMLSEINVIGYVRLVDTNGKEIIFYVETYADGYTPNSFFNIYSYMKDQKETITDAALIDHLTKTSENCYEREYVYLDASAAKGGNGTKAKPYNNFEDAFAASKVKLGQINKPTYLYMQAADGVYEIHNIVSLDGEQIPYKYTRFVITSENGNSTLTSTRKLDSNGFIEQEGNIWMYQFEEDANGEYPFFRYLYVNGKMAELAHNGANSFYTADEYRYMTKFYRYDSGPRLTAQYIYDAGELWSVNINQGQTELTYKTGLKNYPDVKVALNSQFAYYRDQYIVYDYINRLGSDLAPNTKFETRSFPKLMLSVKVENVSTYCQIRFDEVKYNKLAYDELIALFQAEGSNATKFVEKLATYTTKYAKAGTSTPEYEARLREICDTVSKAIVDAKYKDSAVSGILAPYTLINPTDTYPKVSAVDDKENVYVWPEAPSSGIYDYVKSLLDAGELDYTTPASATDAGLAHEVQFLYYRDAFLALRDMEALTDEALSFSVKPNEKGSDQYDELFYHYLYERMAIDELEEAIYEYATKDSKGKVIDYIKAPIATYTTKYTDAPEAYKTILAEIRTLHTSDANHDKTVGADGRIAFNDLTKYNPSVEEKDGPYNGTVPITRPMDDYKTYLQLELVGDQSMAEEQGRTHLTEKGNALKAEAEAKYQAVYKTLTDAIEHYEKLKSEGKTNEAKVYFDNVSGRRREVVAAYETYLKELAIAERYLTDEYDEGFVLEGSGIEMMMPVEWQFNIVQMTGVDYDDKIVKDGVTYVAMYFDPAQWEAYAVMYEGHYLNRMHSLQQSHAYLDMDGEFYYNAEKGQLYYYSENGVDGLNFEYPTLNNMMYFTHIDKTRVENWAFTGLDYTVTSEVGGTWAQSANDLHVNFEGAEDRTPSGSPIFIRRGTGFEVVDCNFHDLGCTAINVRSRTSNILIEGNTFTDLGASAVHCGDATETDVDKRWPDEGQINVVITNNYMDRLAQWIYGANGIALTFNLDCEISYNTIRNTSYSAISVGFSWSFAKGTYEEMKNDLYWKVMHVNIHHNYIESFMQQLGDGGAIYTTGGNAIKEERKLFNQCHDNYIVYTNRTGDGEGRFCVAIYYDGCTTNFDSYNNVVVEASFGASSIGDAYGATTEEKMTDTFFSTIDTPFTKAEYLRRLRNTHTHSTYYYHQTLDTAQSYNITEHDSFIINCRSTGSGKDKGSSWYEAFKNTVTSEDYLYVENMTYVKNPARVPARAQAIIYAAGCDGHKADAYDIANNNY